MLNLLRLVIVGAAMVAMAMSTLLLCVCISTAGVVFAIGGLLLGSSFILACVAWQVRSPRIWLTSAVTFTAWLGATAWLAWQAPDGHAAPGARVQHRYAYPGGAFRRFAFGNLLPEGDQFSMGFRLVPAVDQIFTAKQAENLSGLTNGIYRELEADPDFHALGSVMPETYDELWMQPFNHGHYYLYIPPGLDRATPHPALVFLHGSGGNFKAYTWVLSEVADQLGMVLIAPTYGFGNWREPDTTRLVESALDDASAVVALDRKSVHLMGLSNGGLGVSQAGCRLGRDLRSLTFLSPVFDNQEVDSLQFLQQWRGRPVLVVSGAQDDRILVDYVTEHVAALTRAGVSVSFQRVEDADHFMVFSHRATVIPVITEWLRARLAEGESKAR